jgi:hypothetical protein
LSSGWRPTGGRRCAIGYPAPPSGLPPDQWTPDQRAAGFIHVWPANQRASGFYRHLGFTVISAEGPVIFAMDLRPAA